MEQALKHVEEIYNTMKKSLMIDGEKFKPAKAIPRGVDTAL